MRDTRLVSSTAFSGPQPSQFSISRDLAVRLLGSDPKGVQDSFQLTGCGLHTGESQWRIGRIQPATSRATQTDSVQSVRFAQHPGSEADERILVIRSVSPLFRRAQLVVVASDKRRVV